MVHWAYAKFSFRDDLKNFLNSQGGTAVLYVIETNTGLLHPGFVYPSHRVLLLFPSFLVRFGACHPSSCSIQILSHKAHFPPFRFASIFPSQRPNTYAISLRPTVLLQFLLSPPPSLSSPTQWKNPMYALTPSHPNPTRHVIPSSQSPISFLSRTQTARHSIPTDTARCITPSLPNRHVMPLGT